MVPAAEEQHHCTGRAEVRATNVSPTGQSDVGNAESVLNYREQDLRYLVGPGGSWGMPPWAQRRLVREWKRASKSIGSLWVRELACLITLAAMGLYWTMFPLLGAYHGQSVFSVILCLKHGPASAMAVLEAVLHPANVAAMAVPCELHAFTYWPFSPPSQAQFAAITSHTDRCLERREVCCSPWKIFTTPHKGQPLSVLFWSLLRYLSVTDTDLEGCKCRFLSFPLCSLLSHGYSSEINYLQQALSL